MSNTIFIWNDHEVSAEVGTMVNKDIIKYNGSVYSLVLDSNNKPRIKKNYHIFNNHQELKNMLSSISILDNI